MVVTQVTSNQRSVNGSRTLLTAFCLLIILGLLFSFSPAQAQTIDIQTSFTSAQGWVSEVTPIYSSTDNACKSGGTHNWANGYQSEISTSGAWESSPNNKCSLITTAGNYSGGAGGRGLRYWIGNGRNNGSGPIGVNFPSRVQEFWARWYVRWEPGLKWGFINNPTYGTLSGDQKIVYLSGGYCGTTIGGCYLLLELNRMNLTVWGSSSNYGNNWGWQSLNNGVNSSTGNWHLIELHLKNETNNAANDGRVEVWVDGVLHMNGTAVDFKGSDGFSGFTIPSNHNVTVIGGNPNGDYTTGTEMYNDIDDIAVSFTGKIGGVSSSNPPPGPTPVIGDINLDHIVNAIDYSILNSDWFTNATRSDLNNDGIVNSLDYSILNSNWFKTW